MSKKECVTLKDLFAILDLMENTGIRYWLDGGWGVDALVGKETRNHRDVDIDFDAHYTEQLLQTLLEHGYEVETDWSPVRVELYHPALGYIDIHPFILSDDGTAKQADLEGGFYEFEADFFGHSVLENRNIPCISAKGQMIFHTGYELREVDKHDIQNIQKLLESDENHTGLKTIGLIGGMSWESTVTYYQIINETVKRELGGLHSAKILLYSVDFSEIERYQADGDWDKSARVLGTAALKLQNAGADFIVICTNTMHKVAPQIQEQLSIPLIHIADATADALQHAGIKTTALLGTKYTMTQDFYKDKLTARGITVLIPSEENTQLVNHVIYDELCRGIISPDSRKEYTRIIGLLKENGAEAVILGCTEIGLLIHQEDSPLPVFDTTAIHAEKAALASIS